MAVMFRWFEDNGYSVDIAGARQEYPQLTGFNRWLEQNWKRPAAQRASGAV